jgi:hypothetical protein
METETRMPTIIIQSNQKSAQVTLTERVLAANLDSPHYRMQLIERLAWAIADAEELESGMPNLKYADQDSY